MHRLESALGAVLGSDGTVCGGGHVGPSRWSPWLDNGSCFRKVAPNTRSSEKTRIHCRDQASGCMAGALPDGRSGPRGRVRFGAPGVSAARPVASRVVGSVCHPVPGQPRTGPHLCRSRTAPPCGAHGISVSVTDGISVGVAGGISVGAAESRSYLSPRGGQGARVGPDGAFVRRVRAPSGRGRPARAGPRAGARHARVRRVYVARSPHLVVGLRRRPRSCGPPGPRSVGDRLCWGLLRGVRNIRRGP